MFKEDTVKDEEHNESSGNLSQEFDEVLKQPFSEVEPSKAEPDDMEDFEDKGGNFQDGRSYVNKI